MSDRMNIAKAQISRELPEAEMLEAISTAHEAIKVQCQIQLELAGEVAKSSPKREYVHECSCCRDWPFYLSAQLLRFPPFHFGNTPDRSLPEFR